MLDDTAIKMYNSRGEVLSCIRLPSMDCPVHTVDADTDRDGNLYVLACKTSKDHGRNKKQLYEVVVFDKDGEFKNRFSVRNKSKGRKLALKSNDNHTEVLVLESGETGMYDEVAVYRYETEGAFDHRFGKGIFRDAKDIVSATNGRIVVLGGCPQSKAKSSVHVFDAEIRDRSSEVFPGSVAIAFHRASEHFVVISVSEKRDELLWSMYNINSGAVERTYRSCAAEIQTDPDVTVTSKGRIAIAVTQDFDGKRKGKVLVL